MSAQISVADVEYPESDGKPMGETDLHRGWMFRIIDLLQHRYRGQQVYVTGDLLVYYEQGRTDRFVVPDAFVVMPCAPGNRRTYKIWEEGQPPQVIIEVTSRSTKREDTKSKPKLYEQLGVLEYFLYDPTGDYLKSRLAGYRLVDGRHEPIPPDADGSLVCEQLRICLRVVDGELVMRDIETGRDLQTRYEAAEAEREAADVERKAAETKREAEQVARAAAEARARELEAELERLRAQLKPPPGSSQ